MTTQTRKTRHPYGYCAISILNNRNISMQGKGFYTYLLSKPDKWDFSSHRIAQETKECEKTIRNILKELEGHGLLKRQKLSTGRTVYHLQDPVSECVISKSKTDTESLTVDVTERVEKPSGRIVPQTNCPPDNVTAISKKEANKEIQPIKKDSPTHGEMDNVRIPYKQVETLMERHGEELTSELIQELDYYIASHNPKYKSHYAVINQWAARRKKAAPTTKKNFREREVVVI